MRRPRLKAPLGMEPACYHCVSRVVDGRRVFGEEEKEVFVRYMRLYERLYGLKVLTFCVLGNHFHILVEVPERPKEGELPTDEELVALVGGSKGKGEAQRLGEWLKKWRQTGNAAAAEAERARYFRRMWDVSEFMKVLKQRFSQWFNGRHGRRGTLWEDRFRSVLVERGEALRAMAAYIDLNAVRAGLVEDPKDYRFCGYGEACGGGKRAREGLVRIGRLWEEGIEEREILAWYRCELFGRGVERFDEEGRVRRRGFNAAKAQGVIEGGGRLSRAEYLRLRIRYFTDGAVLGSREYVERVFEARRGWFGPRRRSGARRLRGLSREDPLRTMRALSVRVIGSG